MVWKKVGIKATSIGETQDEAQEELQKEGAGARKKSRTLTARENIGDATWVDVIHGPHVEALDETIDPSGKHFSILCQNRVSLTRSRR